VTPNERFLAEISAGLIDDRVERYIQTAVATLTHKITEEMTMSDTVEHPIAERRASVTELHTEALQALHEAHDAVQAYIDHDDVADATVLHVTARHVVGLLDQALVAMHGSAQDVEVVDPQPVEEPEPEPTPIAAEREEGEAERRWHPQPDQEPAPEA
jgi:hypothetical protein